MRYTIRLKGSAGSGHFGHKGRPGHQGGSLPRDESSSTIHLTGANAARARSMIGSRVVSWNKKDVFDLNNAIKAYSEKNPEMFHGTEKQFYESVQKLLDRSGIVLDDGQFDELGTYFDAWVPDKFEED